MPLTHLEFEQIKRAVDRLRAEKGDGYEAGPVKRADVIDLLMPYVEGFPAPNPNPVVEGNAIKAAEIKTA